MNDFPRCRQRKSVSLSCSEESGVVCGGVVGAFVPGVRRVAPGVGPVSPVKGSVKALPGDSGVLPKPLPRDSGPLTSRPSAQIHIYIYRCFFTLRYPRYISPCLIMTYPGTPSPTPPEIYILPWDHAPPLATAHGVPVPCTPDRRKLVSLPLKVPLKAPRAPPRAQLASAPARHVAAHTHRPQLASFPPRHVAAVPERCACAPVKAPVKDPSAHPSPRLTPPRRRPPPAQPSPPSQLGGPPSPGEGKRRWHHPPTRGPAGAGLGPGPGRRPPPAQLGAAHSGPRDTHTCRPRVPVKLGAAMPASRGSQRAPTPPREGVSPRPRPVWPDLASLHTLRPSFGAK